MHLRDALIQQSPSLALQRAAQDEICKVDALIIRLRSRIWELEDYLEAHDLTKDFEEWLARNTDE